METKQVIVVRKDLGMRKGKIAAQVAHASVGVLLKRGDEIDLYKDRSGTGTLTLHLDKYLTAWLLGPFTKIVVSCADEPELLALEEQAENAGIAYCRITDAGRTEFHGVPTITCLAIGPHDVESIDKLTGHLTLL